MGSTYTDILEDALALRADPVALGAHLWRARRAFSDRFVGTLDAHVPEWRGAVGPRWELLRAARAGPVEPWLALGRLDLPGDWSTPERERLVRWMRGAVDGDEPPTTRDVLGRVTGSLCAQWSASPVGRPRADWLVGVVLRWGGPESVQEVLSHAWVYPPTLAAALTVDRPDVWVFSQRVEHHHAKATWRETARLANLEQAARHGHDETSWGDRVAALDPRHVDDPEGWRVTQARRLEGAMRARRVWSWSSVREVVCSEHPLREMFRALVWDAGVACRLDARGQPRDREGQPCTPRTLRLAHPAASQGMEAWRSDASHQPFAQLEREVYGTDDLDALEGGWSLPRLPAPVHTDGLMGLLRRRRWVLCVGLDNGVIPCFFLHDAFSDTTALCQLARPLFSRSRPSLRALELRIVFLRGAWTRRALTDTYYLSDHATAPAWSSGPRPEHVLPLEDVDPVTLSEVLRDLHDASNQARLG